MNITGSNLVQIGQMGPNGNKGNYRAITGKVEEIQGKCRRNTWEIQDRYRGRGKYSWEWDTEKIEEKCKNMKTWKNCRNIEFIQVRFRGNNEEKQRRYGGYSM